MVTQSWAELLEDILEAGTWTNYRAVDGVSKDPPIRLIPRDSVRGEKNTHIQLDEKSAKEAPIQATGGAVIYTEKSGKLKAFCTKADHRNAIHDDIIAIMNASAYEWVAKRGIKRYTLQKNNFVLEMDLTILN